MPRFSEYSDVEVDIDINPDEFISGCKHSEIEELIDILIEEGYLETHNGRIGRTSKTETMVSAQWIEVCNDLKDISLRITNEDQQKIINILKKYSPKTYI